MKNDSQFTASSRTLSEPARRILYLASLAPSGHNTQPWFVKIISENTWEVGIEPSRRLPFVDPAGRETLLSLGAFIENIAIAAASFQFHIDVKVSAQSALKSSIAEISFTRDRSLSADIQPILLRRVVRKGHLPDGIKPNDLRLLFLEDSDAAQYFPSSGKNGMCISDATVEANIAQTADDLKQKELSTWIRFSDSEAAKFRSGLTPESMEISGAAGFFVRHFFTPESVMSENFRNQTILLVREQLSSFGGWILIRSKSSSVRALIDTGRKFQRIFLRARALSIAVHPMTQLLEEKIIHDNLVSLGMDSSVQFILRAGYITEYPDPVSLRMPVEWFVK